MGRFDWRTIAVVAVVAVAVLAGMIAISGDDSAPPPSPAPTTTAAPTVELELAVWGSDAELAAYQAVVDDYNASSKDATVDLSVWPDADAMLAEVRSGEVAPDLYLLPRADLAEAIAAQRTRPLLDLLVEREIAIGDDYSRDAVAAFSVDDDLQCMPYTASPMVVYYNTELVDFERMAARGLPTPPLDHSSWNLAQFRAAAEFASRPRRDTRGVHIEPTLDGLAPFIYSGGGAVFDDAVEPEQLTLGADDSTGALRQTLELLRDPRLTLTTRQLQQRSAVEWFKRGRLGMIAGYRGLTPELRATEGLEFDVMPMPSLGANQTVGDLTGICLTPGRPLRVTASANFLTYLVSDEAVARVAQTGHLQPSNIRVAFSPAFQQPDLEPAHALVFTNSVRWIVLPPLLEEWEELRRLIDPEIGALLTTPDLGDLGESLRAIDEKSRSVLDPDYDPAESEGASSDAPADDSSGD